MLDQDIIFCTEKIEAYLDDMRPVTSALKQAKQDFRTAEEYVNHAKKEANRCKHVVGQLEHKVNQMRFVLNKMQKHLAELKLQKRFLTAQHKTIKTGE